MILEGCTPWETSRKGKLSKKINLDRRESPETRTQLPCQLCQLYWREELGEGLGWSPPGTARVEAEELSPTDPLEQFWGWA